MPIDPHAALDWLDTQRDAAVARMVRLLAIPSVSTDPAYAESMGKAAAEVADRLRAAGLAVTIHATSGHPIVLGKTKPQDVIGGVDGKPRVLFYGHYDVQPATDDDPHDRWVSPPFEPTLRDGAVYARGASDDKGQVCCFLEALAAWRAAAGDGPAFPVPITVMIEGEEECGSRNLQPFLRDHRDELACDVVLISDTTMWDKDTPAITYGLRGLLYFDLQLHNSARDLHSGMYGGTLANPATMLVRILGRLFDAQNRVTIPGFYDDVQPLEDRERAQWQALGFDEMTHCLGPIGVTTPFGEAGFTTLERKWVRPACDVNGLYGGYGGEGAKTVIPSFAGAKVSFRLAANQDPAKIAQAFRTWLEGQDTGGCRWQITEHGQAHPVAVATDSPYLRAASVAIERCAGKRPVLVREGATIPVVSDFQQLLGADSLLIGFGLSDDRIHAPNEKFDLANFHLGCRTHTALLAQLAEVRRT